MKKAILILAVLFAVVGCQQKNSGESGGDYSAFVNNMKVEGVFSNGNSIFSFNETEHQSAVNAIRKSYRIQTDTGKKYVMMTQKVELKTVGQKGLLNVQVYNIPIANNTYSVEVVKVDGGMVWLWCGDSNLGFVMPLL